MAWSKDAASAAPKVIYTPGSGDANPSVVRVLFDPDAPASRRIVIECTHWIEPGETVTTIDNALGIGA